MKRKIVGGWKKHVELIHSSPILGRKSNYEMSLCQLRTFHISLWNIMAVENQFACKPARVYKNFKNVCNSIGA